MKSTLLVIFLTMSSAFANAATLDLLPLNSLVSISDGRIRLAIKQDGSIEMLTSRIIPTSLAITAVKDQRPVDGDLEISLSKGYKLVQTSGFSIDHIQRIYFIEPNGKQSEMIPEVRLSVK